MSEYKKALKRERLKFFKRLWFYLIPTSVGRSKFLKKHNIFAYMGENVKYGPRFYPTDAEYLKIHNNVCVARDVNFIMHDVLCIVFNRMDPQNDYAQKRGCVEIMDNVFLGSGSQICPNVKVGPNAIVAAGSIVTKDVLPGTVVAGVPAKVIGNFEDVRKQQLEDGKKTLNMSKEERLMYEWKEFYSQREGK